MFVSPLHPCLWLLGCCPSKSDQGDRMAGITWAFWPRKPFHLKMFSGDGRSPGSTFCHKLLVQNWLKLWTAGEFSWDPDLKQRRLKGSSNTKRPLDAERGEVWEAAKPSSFTSLRVLRDFLGGPKNVRQILLFKAILPPKKKTQWGALALRWAAAAISPCASLLQTKFKKIGVQSTAVEKIPLSKIA